MIGIQHNKRIRDDEEDYQSTTSTSFQQLKRRSTDYTASMTIPSKPFVHDFTLKAYTQHHGIVDLQLSKVLAEFQCAVLFCYAHDFTPQAEHDLRSIEDYAQILMKTHHAAPLALSTDHPQVHQAFASFPNGLKFKPSYPMVSDHVRLITNHLGILDQEQGCSKRAILIIDSMRNVFDAIYLQDNQPFPMTTVMSKVVSCCNHNNNSTSSHLKIHL
ncbi:hypothetical protein BDA99DRAFT_491455 [Phascolomyces articulosus]|uniref:Alkyl hydroperoxide reductase subunit C/ Thiol specific antioxidant domain-containing protein n=1 Tax=Phascolomyces articulosus TaxID=60185 RepID=A0AAD5PLX1_9FUNG|nr:hypothetical protein BDA99DRAFT_491455 [Phascolomyces articulosus]